MGSTRECVPRDRHRGWSSGYGVGADRCEFGYGLSLDFVVSHHRARRRRRGHLQPFGNFPTTEYSLLGVDVQVVVEALDCVLYFRVGETHVGESREGVFDSV